MCETLYYIMKIRNMNIDKFVITSIIFGPTREANINKGNIKLIDYEYLSSL
jgi:hypothetical protein